MTNEQQPYSSESERHEGPSELLRPDELSENPETYDRPTIEQFKLLMLQDAEDCGFIESGEVVDSVGMLSLIMGELEELGIPDEEQAEYLEAFESLGLFE